MLQSARGIIRQLIQLNLNVTKEEADDIIDAAAFAVIDAAAGEGKYTTPEQALEDFLDLGASYLWLFLADK